MNIYVKVAFSISIPMAIGGTILARPLIELFFGAQYIPGAIAFQILVWNLTVILGLGVLMNATNRQKKLLIGTGLGALANVILNLALIPKFSLVGASIATLLTEILTLIYFVHESRKIISLPIIRYVYKPAITGVVMGVSLIILHLQVLLEILVGIAIYTVLFLIIKGLSEEDIHLIKKHLIVNQNIQV
jgi:O-antigen/teichoic acid export membrane protein